jgi:hypothetical protein
MSAIRNVVRWIAWQMGDHDATPLSQPPAQITVFSAED